MTLSVKHKFNSAKGDTTDNTLIQPSNWNDEHDIELASSSVVGRMSAGAGPAEEVPIGMGAGKVAPGVHTHPATDVTGLSTVATTGDYNDLLNKPAGTDTTGFMQKASNLSDVANVATARTNLGLGTAATKNTGTGAGNVVVLDANGYLVGDGRNLTNLPTPSYHSVGSYVIRAFTNTSPSFTEGTTYSGAAVDGSLPGTWQCCGCVVSYNSGGGSNTYIALFFRVA